MAGPRFQQDVVQSKRKDGYWVETFKLDPADKVAGLIAYGLDTGTIEFFDNPINQTSHEENNWVLVSESPQSGMRSRCSLELRSQEQPKPLLSGDNSLTESSDWKVTKIAQLDSPVAVAVADVDGDKLDDIIICYNYGEDFIDCNPEGGYIAWLKNPGRKNLHDGAWTRHYIGRWPAMHRLKAGYFTQRTFLELIALPVVHGPKDLSTPIPVIMFQAPDKVTEATSWPRSIIDDTSFTIIHDACKRRFLTNSDSGLESLILASREGLNWMHFTEGGWKKELINRGMPKAPGQEPQDKDFWGCESVDVGKVNGDSFAYIATLEGFHGTTVAVYTKYITGLQTFTWKRHVLDVYGTPTQQSKQGSGPGHFVITADFDNDGNDEFLVALWGPSPEEPSRTPGAAECQGVWYYKPVDLTNGTFAKWKVATDSAARIAVADFRGDDTLSFATISYYVANYYKSPNPQVRVYYNDFAKPGKDAAATQVRTAYSNNEALVCLPRPSAETRHEILPFLKLAGFRLELEVLPPEARRVKDESADAIKVLYGAVLVDEEEIKAFSAPRYSSASAKIENHAYQASVQGAVLIRLIRITSDETSWPHVGEIPLEPLLKVSPLSGPQPDWRFRKVEEGKNFWNLRGIELRFTDQTPLAHLQFWAAGPSTDCGLHNHNDAVFGEVHLSLSAGTGSGGLWWLPTAPTIGESEFDIPNHNDSDFKKLPLKALMEHGPIWFHEPGGVKTMRRPDSSVCYPWHKWQAGNKGKDMDVWMAVEFDPMWLD